MRDLEGPESGRLVAHAAAPDHPARDEAVPRRTTVLERWSGSTFVGGATPLHAEREATRAGVLFTDFLEAQLQQSEVRIGSRGTATRRAVHHVSRAILAVKGQQKRRLPAVGGKVPALELRQDAFEEALFVEDDDRKRRDAYGAPDAEGRERTRLQEVGAAARRPSRTWEPGPPRPGSRLPTGAADRSGGRVEAARPAAA